MGGGGDDAGEVDGGAEEVEKTAVSLQQPRQQKRPKDAHGDGQNDQRQGVLDAEGKQFVGVGQDEVEGADPLGRGEGIVAEKGETKGEGGGQGDQQQNPGGVGQQHEAELGLVSHGRGR